MFSLYFIAIIVITWTIATYYVEQEGPALKIEYGNSFHQKKAILIFDPDPIYNLDEQVCKSIAKALEEEMWKATVVSVAALSNVVLVDYDLFIFCANTYNWSPDRAIKNLVDKEDFFLGKKVAALTVGSGSTKRAHRVFESLINTKDCDLIDSKELWLMRPNDDNSTEKNVKIANEKAEEWGKKLATLAVVKR